MRFSVWPSPANPWEEILELARHCEATGWDGIYFADHFMPNGPGTMALDGDTLECWSVISGLAAAVPRLRLAPLVTSVTYRHPAVLAKIAAAVDQISGGRLTLGVGAGWQENEHASYGIELGTVKQRLDRFEEAVAILVAMLRERRTTFAGSYFHVADAPNQPGPVQSRLPLLIGGRGERRTMRIAARYADEWNSWTSPDELARKVAVLHAHSEEVGRDPAEIGISTQALLFLSKDEAWLADKGQRDPSRPVIVGSPNAVADIVGQYRDAGAGELIIPDFTLGPIGRRKDTLDLFMEEVVPQLG
jgi:F420-dependent oxidoreductase-like protein